MTGLTLEQAVAIVNARAAGAPSDGRLLGEHPDGGPIAVRAGRFGPYVSWNKVNATLPKSMTLETISIEEAVRLIEDKIAMGGGKPGKKPAKKAAAKKAPAKKAGDKKAPAKKAPAKAKAAIEDSDEPPFEGGKPAKAAAPKKPPAKKAAKK